MVRDATKFVTNPDVIIFSGVNIFTTNTEAAFIQDPDVSELAATAVPYEK